MTHQKRDEPQEAPLNRALKSETETIYPTKESSRAPFETTSATAKDGQGWPLVWLLVTLVGIVLALYFLL